MLAAIYVRVSTEEQANKDLSIPAQQARCVAFCQAQGWDVYDCYIDDGYSAKNLDRPAVKRLLRDAENKKFGAVVVFKLDRISRKQKDILTLLEDIFEPLDIGFKSVTQAFDTTTPFGKAALGMLAVFAQLEREQTIERVNEAIKEAARQGRFLGGPIPFGYEYDKLTKTFTINEPQAEIVRWIYETYIQGEYGFEYIAELLSERCIKPPGSAKRWARSTVRQMLKNSFLAGFIEYDGKLFPGKHPAIITLDQYHTAAALQGRRTNSTIAPPALLSGLIYCAECGAKVRHKKVYQSYTYRETNKSTQTYYVCYSRDKISKAYIVDPNCPNGYHRADIVEDWVIHQLHQYSLNEKMLQKLAKELLARGNCHETETKLTAAKKEMGGLQRKLSKWYDAFEKDVISADDLFERIRDLRERKKMLEEEIVHLEEAAIDEAARIISVQDIIDTIRNFDVVWAEATHEERRAILASLIEKITVAQDGTISVVIASE